MEHVKYGIFDLFVFVIPGAFFLFSGYYIESFDLWHPASMLRRSFFSEPIPLFQGLILVAIAYVAGFILSALGNFGLKGYALITRQKTGKGEDKAKKYVMVRHFSKANLNYIEMWNMLKNLSATLAASVILLSIYFLLKFDSFTWLHFATGFLLFLFLLNRASVYHRWAIGDLNAADQNLTELRKSPPL
ncbi:hypothetical protein [Paraflavitalea sp. CAU 1676]|uniref:hypothetical protein n=1 Tax=Paraflavitalea sp. CAU 1676 TaxID=3032598 RepID=UPI0023DC9D7C|nr:hypothetical protein [Paraflavitalea sp. CAU 1676]MDF2188362.1 hypothetical protein [Paraflavitalea sp. CAU 1676]